MTCQHCHGTGYDASGQVCDCQPDIPWPIAHYPLIHKATLAVAFFILLLDVFVWRK